jgi:hypothetical protein
VFVAAPTGGSDEERPAKRRASSPPQAQPQAQAQPRQHSAPGPDPAGAGRFIGGVVGGMLR